ncbi:MAG: serine hydrolase, partial [Acidobacteria bacterium]|nr:serine hydrolase [Acidobacteriota bacterium]
PYTPAALVELFRDKPLDFAPGEKFAYSNSGYHLLGLVVEKASGVPYAKFLQDNIFAPLGMRSTGYDDSRTLVPNRASGYVWTGQALVNAAYLNMAIPFSAGALYSTAEDLLTWDKALYTEKLVPRKTLEEIFTPLKQMSPDMGYAYGWGVGKMHDHQVIWHNGGINGFATDIARFPADRATVIVLSNNENAPSDRIARDLSAILFGAPYKIPVERKVVAVASATLDKYAGQYQLAPGLVLTITNDGGKLSASAPGQPVVEMLPSSETEFFLKVVDAQVTFVTDAQGRVTGLVLHQGGRDTPAKKIK